ncbi:MAG: thioredoxin family protein [Flavobacteriales bacterium]|nr:thioredoxin family protein [Flavobacteriales bacterium]
MAIVVLGSVLAFGHTTQTYTFMVQGMTCNGRVQGLTEALLKMEGVKSNAVDYGIKTGKVLATNEVTFQTFKVAVKGSNFEALSKYETLSKPLTKEERKELDIVVIKGGNKIKFKDHLAYGKITIFDFYADWCGPCRVFSPKVERLIKNNPNVALRKVDIVTWKSELSKQLIKDHLMPALPFIIIFDNRGKVIGKIAGNRIKHVESIVKHHSN